MPKQAYRASLHIFYGIDYELSCCNPTRRGFYAMVFGDLWYLANETASEFRGVFEMKDGFLELAHALHRILMLIGGWNAVDVDVLRELLKHQSKIHEELGTNHAGHLGLHGRRLVANSRVATNLYFVWRKEGIVDDGMLALLPPALGEIFRVIEKGTYCTSYGNAISCHTKIEDILMQNLALIDGEVDITFSEKMKQWHEDFIVNRSKTTETQARLSGIFAAFGLDFEKPGFETLNVEAPTQQNEQGEK